MSTLAAVSDFQPGIWTLLVIALLLGLAVWTALRARRAAAEVSKALPDDAWTVDALNPQDPGKRMLLALTNDDLRLLTIRGDTGRSWAWSEIGTVIERSMRSRLNSYPGLRISFVDGESIDLLVPLGTGRSAYADGARETQRRIAEHLRGGDQPQVGESSP
ncbi:hypothetical protein EK0264_02830 [Epidermidibacterium keratini]|uniref:Uncharacterized protein n=1 Tax=Epidermidibacterium keratini TaxID=1891644 RepID=A0A7L4YJ38_9ACTN|nr:hypothetical protein [Epidermidibacterium keratini]QHB99324.1 hypothetical protein EK0264_02830 [Epidermidibacterium keratini]